MKLTVTPKWGIRIFAVWALVLAFLAFANLLLLTKSVELYSNQYGNQAQVWIIFILQSGFGAGFAASAYGLWQQQNWGRVLFLWTIAIWFGVNIIALLVPGIILFSIWRQSTTEIVFNGIRFAIALFIPLWYLNRSHIKAMFYGEAVSSQ